MEKFKRNKKIFFILFLLMLIITISYWVYKSKNKNEQKYQTEKIIKEDLTESISTSGQITNSAAFVVYTQASGVVKNVFIKNDQIIKKGDKILEIELDEIGQQKYQTALANYLAAKNNLDTAQNNLYSLQADMFDKWQSFYNLATSSTYQNSDGTPNETNRQLPEFLISKNNWLLAEAKYKSQQNQIVQAQAQVNSARISLQLFSPIVYAPMTGKITDMIYDVGMSINNNSSSETSIKIATIKNQSPIFGQFTTSEADVYKIKPGQKVIITIDALPGATFTGEVVALDKTGQISSSVVSYPLTIKIDGQNEKILPNMSATANIIINRKNNVLTVPTSAIIQQGDTNYLRILKNNQIVLKAVETGISSEDKTEIISGVSEGEEVVVSIISNNPSSSSQSPFSGFGFGSNQRIRIIR